MLAVVQYQQNALEPNAAAMLWVETDPAASDRPSAVATVTGTNSGSDKGPSSAIQTPLENLGNSCRATSSPNRVLPMPPMPASVTRRCVIIRSDTSAIAVSRPMSSEMGSGRLDARRGEAVTPRVRISPVNW